MDLRTVARHYRIQTGMGYKLIVCEISIYRASMTRAARFLDCLTSKRYQTTIYTCFPRGHCSFVQGHINDKEEFLRSDGLSELVASSALVPLDPGAYAGRDHGLV